MSLLLAMQINYSTLEYKFYSNIFLLTFGVISNVSLILIFATLRVYRDNQCAFFLMVESVANTGFLLTILTPYFFSCVTGQDPTITSLIWCKLQLSLLVIFGLCSLFTICLLTFDQFMSTNPRLSWRQISTLKLAHRLTLVNVSFVIVHSIPFLVLIENKSSAGCTIYNPVLSSYLTFFYYPILSSIFPIVVTVTFSLLAYRNVRRIVRRQIPVVRRRLDRQLTAMVLARVVCLLVLGLPYIFYSMYRLIRHVADENQLEIAIDNLVGAVSSSLLYMNFAVSWNVINNHVFF